MQKATNPQLVYVDNSNHIVKTGLTALERLAAPKGTNHTWRSPNGGRSGSA